MNLFMSKMGFFFCNIASLRKHAYPGEYSSIHGEILKEFDAQLCAKEIDRFGLDADTDPRWLHLPLRCGGFGLFLLAELQPAAIIGAVAGFLASAELFVRP